MMKPTEYADDDFFWYLFRLDRHLYLLTSALNVGSLENVRGKGKQIKRNRSIPAMIELSFLPRLTRKSQQNLGSRIADQAIDLNSRTYDMEIIHTPWVSQHLEKEKRKNGS